jgi:hypothetical protein
MNQPKNFAVLHENQTTSYQISGVAGTNSTVLEEEEDPSVANLSDYEDAVQSDIHINIEGGGSEDPQFPGGGQTAPKLPLVTRQHH